MPLDAATKKGQRPFWKTALFVLGGAVVFVYLLTIAFFVAYRGKLIFPVPKNVVARTPLVAGLAFEDLKIPVDGKSYIHAWWIPSQDAHARTILYFHGNGEVLENEASREAVTFHQTGANLLLVDYRGYGQSSPLQTTGLTAAADALAAMHYLKEQRHITASSIVIFGWSIGTGVAAQLAVDAPDAGGLILVSPITSVDDVGNQSWIFRYLLRPTEWVGHEDDFDTKDKIGSIHMPVLMMTGTVDQIAPPWMARELHARANEPKQIQFILGAGHNDVMKARDGTFLRQIEVFLASLPKGDTNR